MKYIQTFRLMTQIVFMVGSLLLGLFCAQMKKYSYAWYQAVLVTFHSITGSGF